MELLNKGVIGEIRHFKSSFGFPPLPPENFRYKKELGGGALYDAGAYPVRASFMLFGDDISFKAATLKRAGHDIPIFGSAFLDTGNGVGASISFGFDNYYQCNYEFWGTSGKLSVLKSFTPKADEVPQFKIEINNKEKLVESYADNHFVKALQVFKKAILSEVRREKLYKEILQQSKALTTINKLAN